MRVGYFIAFAIMFPLVQWAKTSGDGLFVMIAIAGVSFLVCVVWRIAAGAWPGDEPTLRRYDFPSFVQPRELQAPEQAPKALSASSPAELKRRERYSQRRS